jgi:hypothetical protein
VSKHLVFSAFVSKPIFLLACNWISLCLLLVFDVSPNKLTSSVFIIIAVVVMNIPRVTVADDKVGIAARVSAQSQIGRGATSID